MQQSDLIFKITNNNEIQLLGAVQNKETRLIPATIYTSINPNKYSNLKKSYIKSSTPIMYLHHLSTMEGEAGYPLIEDEGVGVDIWTVSHLMCHSTVQLVQGRLMYF